MGDALKKMGEALIEIGKAIGNIFGAVIVTFKKKARGNKDEK